MSRSKRAADSQINHENWQDEEEPEEAGEFRKASEEELKKRVIKTAKRRGIGGNEDGKSSAFSGFGGFGTIGGSSLAKSSASDSPFSFLSKIPSSSITTNGSALSKTATTLNASDAGEKSKSLTYYEKVKSLNESVSGWIKKNVDENPLCILTPIFKDYEKHLKEIDNDKDTAKDEDKNKSFSFGLPKNDKPENNTTLVGSFNSTVPATSTINKGISFGSNIGELANKSSASGISFGSPVTSTQKTESQISFKFGSPSSNTETAAPAKPLFSGFGSGPSAGFSFGSQPSFSFGNVAPPPKKDDDKTENAENEDEEPPKNEFVPVVEENSIYSKRCKVFVKSGADYSDRGVSTLFLKKIEDSGKIQLIARAETSLGNILLNLILTEGLPASRLGKNNVMLVCLPTPDAKPPPTSVLLRVKTGEEADQLLDEIKKHI